MDNLLQLKQSQLNLIMKNGDLIRIFIDKPNEAKEETVRLNEVDEDNWVEHTLENVLTYGVVKKKNIVSIITEFGIPIIAYLNNLYKAESDFARLSKDVGKDYGTYQIIRDIEVQL